MVLSIFLIIWIIARFVFWQYENVVLWGTYSWKNIKENAIVSKCLQLNNICISKLSQCHFNSWHLLSFFIYIYDELKCLAAIVSLTWIIICVHHCGKKYRSKIIKSKCLCKRLYTYIIELFSMLVCFIWSISIEFHISSSIWGYLRFQISSIYLILLLISKQTNTPTNLPPPPPPIHLPLTYTRNKLQ